jgi:magnesium transporter
VHIHASEGGGDVLHCEFPSHAVSASSPSLPYVLHPGSISHRFLDGLDVPNLKKRGGGICNWIHVEAATASV